MTKRIEVSRAIPARPAEIFAVLRDPHGHVDIDATGMLIAARRHNGFSLKPTSIGPMSVHMIRQIAA
jgi:hypothetical protein